MHNSYSIASFYKWEEALETGFPPFGGKGGAKHQKGHAKREIDCVGLS